MQDKIFECKKVKYSTKEFALFDIERIKKKSKRNKIPNRAYLCKCGSWHLTSGMDNNKILISKLQLENFELKERIKELTKINQDVLSELEKDERLKIRKDKTVLELKTGLKTTQKHNKSLIKTNADLIHKNLMLEKKLESLQSKI